MIMKIDWVVYIIFAIVLLKVWITEHKDIHCPRLNATPKECEEGQGMCYSYTRPKESDTCKELIEKIYKAAGAENNIIQWRKTLIVSTVISLSILLVVLGSIPDWRTFFLSIIVCYVIIFAVNNYYSYHVFGEAKKNIRDNLKILSKYCDKTL